MNSRDEGNSIGTVTPSPVERGLGGEVLKSSSLVEERGEVIKNGLRKRHWVLIQKISEKSTLRNSTSRLLSYALFTLS